MKKFDIFTDHFEFRFGKGPIPAMTEWDILETHLSCDDRITSNSIDPKRVASFDTEAEARSELAKSYSNYASTKSARVSSGWILCGEIAWIEENEYDEDGEFDQGGETIAFVAAPYHPADDETFTYARALMLNESKAGLDLTDVSLDDLLAVIEELPGWDYPLAEELMGELARRAGIDVDAYFAEGDRDYSDLWASCAEALGVEF